MQQVRVRVSLITNLSKELQPPQPPQSQAIKPWDLCQGDGLGKYLGLDPAHNLWAYVGHPLALALAAALELHCLPPTLVWAFQPSPCHHLSPLVSPISCTIIVTVLTVINPLFIFLKRVPKAVPRFLLQLWGGRPVHMDSLFLFPPLLFDPFLLLYSPPLHV